MSKLTQESFVKRAKDVHGNKYNYDRVVYVNSKQKVCIRCTVHDFEFWQIPNSHLLGFGCELCGRDRTKQASIKHGLRHHPDYSVWKDMMSRCYNTKTKNYKFYGEKGVVVCDRWHDVKNFVEDVCMLDDYDKKKDGYSFDRKNPYGNYTPENCRWTDSRIQNVNQRLRKTNKTGYPNIMFNGKNYTVSIRIGNRNRFQKSGFETLESAVYFRNDYIIRHNLPNHLCRYIG